MDVIFKFSSGIPRLINIMCDFLLLAAFAEELKDINEEMILEIVADLDFNNHYWASGQPETSSDACISATTVHSPAIFPEEQLEVFWGKICLRLDQLEKESLALTRANLRGFNARIDQVRDTLLMHLSKTNSAVGELSQKIENSSRIEPSMGREKLHSAEPIDPSDEQASNDSDAASGYIPKSGLIRRIFS